MPTIPPSMGPPVVSTVQAAARAIAASDSPQIRATLFTTIVLLAGPASCRQVPQGVEQLSTRQTPSASHSALAVQSAGTPDSAAVTQAGSSAQAVCSAQQLCSEQVSHAVSPAWAGHAGVPPLLDPELLELLVPGKPHSVLQLASAQEPSAAAAWSCPTHCVQAVVLTPEQEPPGQQESSTQVPHAVSSLQASDWLQHFWARHVEQGAVLFETHICPDPESAHEADVAPLPRPPPRPPVPVVLQFLLPPLLEEHPMTASIATTAHVLTKRMTGFIGRSPSRVVTTISPRSMAPPSPQRPYLLSTLSFKLSGAARVFQRLSRAFPGGASSRASGGRPLGPRAIFIAVSGRPYSVPKRGRAPSIHPPTHPPTNALT
jgi:hypothetical protein